MTEIIVTSTADSGAGSLRQAIADAQDGDVIRFDPLVFPVGQSTAILLASQIAVNKNITIDAGSPVEFQGVVRDVEGVKTIVEITDESPAQTGERVVNFLRPRVVLNAQGVGRCAVTTGTPTLSFTGLGFQNGSSGNGAAFYSNAETSVITFESCAFYNNEATSNGGVYLGSGAAGTFNDCVFALNIGSYGVACYVLTNAEATLNDCVIVGNSATTNGVLNCGAASVDCLRCSFFDNAAPNGAGVWTTTGANFTASDCVFAGNVATTNGGAVFVNNTATATLTNCSFTYNSANNGGGVMIGATAQVTLQNCSASGNTASEDDRYRGVSVRGTSSATLINCNLDAFYVVNTASATVSGGVSLINTLYIRGGASVTIADGAALSVTTAATIEAATISSAGRGYLALAPGLDASAATLTNVVLCSYGADASLFHEDLGVLYWTAENPTTHVLLEYEAEVEGETQWTTLIQTAGESYTRYFGPGVNLRLFDGEKFLTTSTPSSRTYYYIGGAEGSFTAAADWSLTRGGVAIPEAPTVKNCVFVVGDVAATAEEETTEETSEEASEP